jgi:hypothetical protein
VVIPLTTKLGGMWFFLHKGPLLVTLYRSWRQVMNLLIMEALSMTATGFEQPGHGFLRHFRQSRG